MARQRQSTNEPVSRPQRLWILLGAGAAVVVIAIAIIAVFAFNQLGGDSSSDDTIVQSGGVADVDSFPEYVHTLGDADAPVTVIEYSDFQ